MTQRTAVQARVYRSTPSGRAAQQRYNRSGKAKARAQRHAAKRKLTSAAYKKRTRDEIRELIRSTKSVPCMDCGGTFDPVCMDFDHRPDKKKSFTIGATMHRHSIETVRVEIAKCDVVCANCHRLRTHRHRDHRIASNPRPEIKMQTSLALDGEGATIVVAEWKAT